MSIKNYDLNEAPPMTTLPCEEDFNKIYYNCSECSSAIEILSINDKKNIIEFKCLNKDNNHGKKSILIKDYLNEIRKYNIIKENEDKCIIHKNKFTNYCLNCRIHLCNECLKERKHINHIKKNIIEIQPTKEKLTIIDEVLKYYDIKIEQKSIKKISRIKEIEKLLLNDNKYNEAEAIDQRKLEIILNKENELKLNKEKYISDIEEIKKNAPKK